MADEEVGTEDLDLAGDYVAEDPSILTDEELKHIADLYGLSVPKIKVLAKAMSKARKEIDPEDLSR